MSLNAGFKLFVCFIIPYICVQLENSRVYSEAEMTKIGVVWRVADFDGVIHTDNLIGSPFTIDSLTSCVLACFTNSQCHSLFLSTDGSGIISCQLHSNVFFSEDGFQPSPTAIYWAVVQGDCPTEDGYILHQPSLLCYRLILSAKNWPGAQADCESQNGHLINLKSLKQYEHIRSFLLSQPFTTAMHQVLIGGRYENSAWTWTDNSSMNLTSWRPYEPSYFVGEDCLAVLKTNAAFNEFDYYMNNVPCVVYSTSYLCQVDLTS